MIVWMILYVLFVILLMFAIYATVYLTYTQLHKREGFTSDVPVTEKCVLFTSDKVAQPWDDSVAWIDKCKTQDADKLVAGIEALVNLGDVSVKSISSIPTSNLQQVYFPVGTTRNLRIEFTKGKHDVYPKQVFVKEGFLVTIISEGSKMKKVFTETKTLEAADSLSFKNATVEVKEVVAKTEDVKSELKDFVLKGKLKSKMNTSFCLTAKKNSQDVITSECTPDYKEQEWKRDDEGRIVSVATNSCLHVKHDNTIVQQTCETVPRQIWKTDSTNRLVASNSSTLCMQPNGDSVVENANLVMKNCQSGLLQQWSM